MFLIFSCNYGNESLKNNEIHGYGEQIHRCLIPKLYIFFFFDDNADDDNDDEKKEKKITWRGHVKNLLMDVFFYNIFFCSVTKLIKKNINKKNLIIILVFSPHMNHVSLF